MLGAVMATVRPPDSKGKKRQPKHSKGEKSVAQPNQQHGELATAMSPRQEMRHHAKSSMKRATESWISGHMSTSEHSAVHARAKHVLSGKHPHEFKGKTGERKIRGL
jgi:hypothetical protein